MPGTPPPGVTRSQIQQLLTLEQIAGCDVFVGPSRPGATGRLFGGQVAAQAVVAASSTVPQTHRIHSLHSYFLLAGDATVEIVFAVDRLRDGRSFKTRQVVAKQQNRPIFLMIVSFHVDEPGPEYQMPFTEVKFQIANRIRREKEVEAAQSASALATAAVTAVTKWKKKKTISDDHDEVFHKESTTNGGPDNGSSSNSSKKKSSRLGMIKRPHELGGEESAVANMFADPNGSTVHLQAERGNSWMSRWSKHRLPLPPDDWTMHCAILTYLSDIGQVGTVTLPLKSTIDGSPLSFYDWKPGMPMKTMSMSLDHSIYFHRAFHVDKWLLFHTSTSVSHHARGLARTEVFSQRGVLIATIVQEALVRELRPKSSL